MPFGDPPSYSTPRTLGLALVSVLGALVQFALGAAEYTRMGRFPGLWEMIVAGLLLVYGVLTLIRFAEAKDALGDPQPRTPMYGTPHEWATFWAGLGVNGLAALVSLSWAVQRELSVWHGLAALINLLGAWLAWKTRPRKDEL